MATEDSVMKSLSDLFDTEDARRKEQIALAQLRKVTEQRRQHEADARAAQARQRDADAEKRVEEEKADAARRAEAERVMVLERTRAELELQTKVTLLRTEQQHALERLALMRDARVAALERTRWVLSVALGLLLVGATCVYGIALFPKSRLQDESIRQLNEQVASERAGHAQERLGLNARVVELEATVSRLHVELDTARREHSAISGRPGHERLPTGRPATGTHRTPRTEERCLDENDPLCGHLRAN